MIEQSQLVGEERIRGKFGREFSEQLVRVIDLMLALAGEGQPGFREHLQIVAVFGGSLQLLQSAFAIAVNPAEPEERALVTRQASDDVIGCAQRHVSVFRGRINGEQFRGFGVRLLRQAQTRHLFFHDQRVVIGFHAVGHGEHEQALAVARIAFQALHGHFARHMVGVEESIVAVFRRGPLGAAQELFVAQEKLGREDAFGVELLVEIAGRFGSLAHRIGRFELFVGDESLATAFEIQLVKITEAGVEHARGWISLDARQRRRFASSRDGLRFGGGLRRRIWHAGKSRDSKARREANSQNTTRRIS